MVTNDERREVAKALREANFYMSYRSKRDMWDELRRIVGEYRDTPFGGVYTFARLADLIDPDTTTNTTKSPELTTKCDRDALLALADEMTVEKGDIWRWSSRIREALGVES